MTPKSTRIPRLESYPPFWIGLVALVMAAVVVAALLIARTAGFGYTSYHAEFAQAAQLRVGDNVSVAGISVGEVKSVALAGDRVVVALRVRDDVRLGAQTRAAIKLTTLLGSRYVELRPRGEEPLQDKLIRLTYTEVPYDLQSLLADSTSTFEQVDTGRLASALTVLSEQLDGLPEALPQAMTNLQRLSGIIAARRDQIGTLLQASATLTDTLRRQQANLGQLVFQGRDLLAEIISRQQSFRQLMSSLTQLVNLLSKAVVADRPAAQKLVDDLLELSAMAAEHDDLFRNTLQTLPIPIRNLTNASGTAPALDIFPANGILIDDWMCAISGRATQFNLVEYFKDCA
ncbi:MCE family protein [Mycolicibacterium holsaticum]|nr:MlaD family protein [Mycolicibacterium holsaticum]QZA15454.1 MCE family protein [Mycolicibacterium holsaticum DSM 44478 = JCM 12374]UNC12274.1 MCE family protein [Mycolicibacterium holsaticum DSM 44478 = JCM 12374]